MQIIGKIIKSFPLQSGTTKSGKSWKCREVEVKTVDPYPDTFKLRFFGDKIDLLKGKDTKTAYEFSINVKGRKSSWKEKDYYNVDLDAWKIEAITEQKAAVDMSAPLNVSDLEDDDDLLF